MPGILEEFKKERDAISGLLEKLKRLGVHTMEGRSELVEAKEQLCVHMKRQIKELYPELKKKAPKDARAKKYVENFEDEIEKTIEFCMNFFNRYSIDGGGVEFLRDFERLKKNLEKTLEDEEIFNGENG
jgi:hypothetical protein